MSWLFPCKSRHLDRSRAVLSRGVAERPPHFVFVLPLIGVTALALSGCHSANINATVSNHTAKPISLIQVEYPSASFGTQSLAPGQDFKYRFKVLGSGEMKLTFTDAAQLEHKSVGPSLNEGSQGALAVVVTDFGVLWQPAITTK